MAISPTPARAFARPAQGDFEDRYLGENQIRVLSTWASALETLTEVPVMRCHLGEPTGPTLSAANEFMWQYLATRCEYAGYADHTGLEPLRAVAAKVLTQLNRFPQPLDASKIICVPGGTGALNTAFAIFGEDVPVLVTDPDYPPWQPIAEQNGKSLVRFPLREADNFLLEEQELRSTLRGCNPRRPAVLLYHYPHNPTGKVLSPLEAEHIAGIFNRLVKEFPKLALVQEDLYLATVHSDLPVVTPVEFMSPETLQRTIVLHSPSKEGHGQDRGALIATMNPHLARRMRGASSFNPMGASTAALVGTVRTLADIAGGGLMPRGSPGMDPRCHRYATADYYQERIQALGSGVRAIETALDVRILPKGGLPLGTYYLWCNFDCLKGAPVPQSWRDAVVREGKLPALPAAVTSSQNLQQLLVSAAPLGLQPTMIAHGEMFTQAPGMFARMAAVERNPESLRQAANTLKGVVCALKGIDPRQLGVETRSPEQLRTRPERIVGRPPTGRAVYSGPPHLDDLFQISS